jgi:two-component system, LytTR family, sensor kinase
MAVQSTSIVKKYFVSIRFSLWLFFLLTCIGVVRGLQHYFVVDAYNPVQFGLWWHIPFNLFMWWIWFLFFPAIYFVEKKIDSSINKLSHWLLLYFLLPLVIIVIRQAVASFIITIVLVGYSEFFPLLFVRILANVWIWIDIAVYFAIVFSIRLVEYRRQNEINEVNLSRLQGQVSQSRLDALRSQLHPHFLFNTLNTLSTLILKKDNNEAERMLALLNNFLKTTLQESNRNEITLKEELRFINDYLEIEKVRFHDKLEVREEIDEETLTASVPNFLLQPIVENAIHHAIAPKTADGVLYISTRKEHDNLSIVIEDNGPGLISQSKKKSKEGKGMKITKERLSQLFGERYVFRLDRSAFGGVKVFIQIPFIQFSGSEASL